MTLQVKNFARKPLYAAIVGGLVLLSQPAVIQAETGVNPTAESQVLMLAASCSACNPCNPCAACNPCNPCNPCAACNPCNPCNPCAACNPCNPCNPCAACNPCNPCNPCAACNPCNPCAAACNPYNPCAASACNPCSPYNAVGGSTLQISGVLIDSRCYAFDNNNITNAHMMLGGANVPNCASACAKMGIPVAVLEGGIKGGSLYTISAPASVFAAYMGMETRMVGKEISQGIVFPASIEVKTDSGWQKVKAKGMF